jgi:hypothetical protein
VELHVDDDAFVRAPVALVYPRLTDLGAWSDWWPGVRTTRTGEEAAADGSDTAPTEVWDLTYRASWSRRPIRVVARPGQWRHDAGFRLDLEADLEGWAEFWLEDDHGGTVVHHLLVAGTAHRRPVRLLRDYRLVLRRGLWELKDDLQREVRTAQGVAP